MIYPNDIVPYYFGSPFRFTFKNGDIIESIVDTLNDSGFICGTNTYLPDKEDDWFEIDNYRKDGKLELKLIDPVDMSEKQKRDYKALCKRIIDTNGGLAYLADTPESIHYLFTNGIDAFDLIKNGHAIKR